MGQGKCEAASKRIGTEKNMRIGRKKRGLGREWKRSSASASEEENGQKKEKKIMMGGIREVELEAKRGGIRKVQRVISEKGLQR